MSDTFGEIFPGAERPPPPEPSDPQAEPAARAGPRRVVRRRRTRRRPVLQRRSPVARAHLHGRWRRTQQAATLFALLALVTPLLGVAFAVMALAVDSRVRAHVAPRRPPRTPVVLATIALVIQAVQVVSFVGSLAAITFGEGLASGFDDEGGLSHVAGAQGAADIPPDAPLAYEVDVVDIRHA